MNTSLLLIFLFFTLPFLFHTSYANPYNITLILEGKPRFSTFNSYLTQFAIAAEINSRQPVTVLAVDNHAMELLSGKPKDIVQKIMSVHVVLDFYDVPKLQSLHNETATVVTLFQATGEAVADQGILKAAALGINSFVFTSGPSGGSGSNVRANVANNVVDHPYYLSVLEITNLIIPPGIEDSQSTSPPHADSPASPQPPRSPAPSQANAPASHTPVSPHHGKAPTPSHGNETGSTQPHRAPTPSQASAPVSPQHGRAPGSPHIDRILAPSHANASGSPQPSRALIPSSHANAPGSPQAPMSPTPSYAYAPGSPHHSMGPSPYGANSPFPSNVDVLESVPEPNDSGSTSEARDEVSYGTRMTSNISLNVVFATRLLILAFLWMIC